MKSVSVVTEDGLTSGFDWITTEFKSVVTVLIWIVRQFMPAKNLLRD